MGGREGIAMLVVGALVVGVMVAVVEVEVEVLLVVMQAPTRVVAAHTIVVHPVETEQPVQQVVVSRPAQQRIQTEYCINSEIR